MSRIIPLHPGKTYHIYNNTVGNINCFTSQRNSFYFLKRYNDIIVPIADTAAYSLLPNEFHFLVRINDEKRIGETFGLPAEKIPFYISRQFGNFFLSYTNAFNKQEKRRGSLFLKPFRRTLITDDFDLIHTVKRIHLRPVSSNLCSSPEHWQFSSYPRIINEAASLVSIDPSSYFSSRNDFINFHYNEINLGNAA